MADFYPAAQQIQYPDILGSYLRGIQAPMQLQAQQQESTLRGLNIEQLQQILRGRQLMASAWGANDASNPQGPQNQPQANMGGPSGGIQNGPQGAVSHVAPPPAPASGYAGIQPSPVIHALATDLNPNMKQLLAGTALTGGDVFKVSKEAREDALASAKMQFAEPMSQAENVISSPDADKLIWNNPNYQQIWRQFAPMLGRDPNDPKALTPEAARSAATLFYNHFAALSEQPTKPMPTEYNVTRGPAGEVYATNRLTNEPKQVTGENLKQVVGPGGVPQYLPSDQAAGRQPFNASIFGASQLSDQALQFAADTYRNTGKMPAAFGRSPAMQAKVLDRVAADASATGDTTTAIAARTAARNANGQALTQNTKLEAATTSYYNTLDKNLTNLQELAGKVDSTGSPLVNKVFRAWQQGVAGDPDVAKYVTYLNSAASEFAKIQSGSLGNAPVSDAARKHADDVINKFMSQGQINAVAEAMRGEGNNRLSSIREERQSLMGSLGQGAPGTATAPQPSAAGGAQAPRVNAQGWVLHADKNGNKAYVSPDGKQFQPVQ